jgi:serine/threonine protein kinase
MAPFPVLSGFDILRPLGGGVLMQVFAARRRVDSKDCAIKLPRGEWADHADAHRLLRREARALTAVNHPRIVRIIEARLNETPPYLALELLSGESLRDRLQRDSALDQRTGLWIARQIAEGIQAVHNSGFVHGDIKPDNVQILDDGSAVILDFGFAHRPIESGLLESDGYVLGTANYLAPERTQQTGDPGFAADWFSFGVTLFEMLAGELPFAPRSVGDVLNHAIWPTEILAMPRDWPDRLTAMVKGLSQNSPMARPRGPMILHELVALEIAALGHRRAG